MGVTVLVFVVELQKVRTRTGASFKMGCMRKGEESIKKICFYRIYSGAPRAREARAERSTMGKKIW